MKILWHFNSHRHFEEYSLSSHFFNKSDFLKKNSEVLVTCNNVNIDIDALKSQCFYECKFDVVRTTNPKNGVNTGQFVSLDETFYRFFDYDYVIHTTPDVYIVKDKFIVKLLEEEFDSNNHMIVDYHPCYKFTYCTDFFIFKPKLVTNFFNDKFEPTPDCNSIEAHLYKSIHDYKIPHKTICRGRSSLSWQVDDFGLIHNHNKDIIKKIILNNEYPDETTAYSHNNPEWK